MPALYHRVEQLDNKRSRAVPCYCQQVELPLEQPYRLTSMIRSHERKTDELVPAPTKVDLGERQIRLPFPAEHKWASHISRYSIFPPFDTNRSDLRYTSENWHYPKNASLPSKRDDYYVQEKQRCDSRREETIMLPLGSSHLQHSQWPTDLHFQVYPRNADQQTYPIPPKLILPTMPVPVEHEQQLGIAVSARAANTARNYQQDLWKSTTHRHFTGLGDQHPYALDDYDEKMLKFPNTDVNLQQCSVDTMVPSTSFGGRASPTYKQVALNQQLYKEFTYVPNVPSMMNRMSSSSRSRSRSPSPILSGDDELAERRCAAGESETNCDQRAEMSQIEHDIFTSASSKVSLDYLMAKDVSLLRRKYAQQNMPQKDVNESTQVVYQQERQLAMDQMNEGRPLIPFSYSGLPTTRFSTDNFSRLQNSYPRSIPGHVMLDAHRHQKLESSSNYLNRLPMAAREQEPSACTEEERGQRWKEYLREAVLRQRDDGIGLDEKVTQSARLAPETSVQGLDKQPVNRELLRALLTEREKESARKRLDATGDALDKLKGNFLKIEAHARFNESFPEKTPKIYDNNYKGRRHVIVFN